MRAAMERFLKSEVCAIDFSFSSDLCESFRTKAVNRSMFTVHDYE